MADKKTWWERLPEPFASIKGNALWSVISVVLGALIAGLFGSKIAQKSVLVGAYIAFAAIGVAFLIGGVISFLKARANDAAIEGVCSVVISDCTYILKTYKRLDYENRERVRYPLSKSSWPSFGQPWDLFAVELYCGYDNFDILKLKIGSLWITAGRKDSPRILRLTDATVMLDVIEALEELLANLVEMKS
jgi:hypothetical protein